MEIYEVLAECFNTTDNKENEIEYGALENRLNLKIYMEPSNTDAH